MRKWSDGGRLPAFYTPGGHRRFRRDDLDAFLAGSAVRSERRAAAIVLVVDDDRGLREYIRANLEAEGYLGARGRERRGRARSARTRSRPT